MAPEQTGIKRKRGRPPAATSNASEPQGPDANEADNEQNDIDANDEGSRPKKRGRPSGRREKTNQESARTSPRLQDPSSKSRKTRRGAGAPQQSNEPEEQQPQTKRARRAAKEPADESTQAKGKKRRGRPSRTRQSLESQETAGAKQRRGRRRKSSPEVEAEEGDDADEGQEEPTSEPRRRGRPKPSPERRSSSPESDPDLPAKPYLHVAPYVRGIKQSTIDEKWSALTGPSIAAATETLELAHRPILQRLSNSEQRRQYTSAALAVLYKRITRKLHRGLPFPPAATSGALVSRRGGDGGRELELDFESVIDAAQTLERQLDPALHAVELLRKEKEWMERELEKDYKTLQNLEAGARGQVREHREQMKKAHTLAPTATRPKGREDMDLVLEGQDTSVPPGTVFKDLENDELKELALQLGGHVESIKTNLQQTDGLLPQLTTSRAALRGVLCEHLGQAQYEKVLFG